MSPMREPSQRIKTNAELSEYRLRVIARMGNMERGVSQVRCEVRGVRAKVIHEQTVEWMARPHRLELIEPQCRFLDRVCFDDLLNGNNDF